MKRGATLVHAFFYIILLNHSRRFIMRGINCRLRIARRTAWKHDRNILMIVNKHQVRLVNCFLPPVNVCWWPVIHPSPPVKLCSSPVSSSSPPVNNYSYLKNLQSHHKSSISVAKSKRITFWIVINIMFNKNLFFLYIWKLFHYTKQKYAQALHE